MFFKSSTWSAAFFTDVPASPRTVTCENATSSTMDISWMKPLCDGGSSVTGYVIEAYSRLSVEEDEDIAWITVARITGEDVLNHTVADLDEGRQYSFRVKAQNRAGSGKASDETAFVTAIDARGLKIVLMELSCRIFLVDVRLYLLYM